MATEALLSSLKISYKGLVVGCQSSLGPAFGEEYLLLGPLGGVGCLVFHLTPTQPLGSFCIKTPFVNR